MTISGAISGLNNLLKADDMPSYYKPSIQKIIETVEMEQSNSDLKYYPRIQPKKVGHWVKTGGENLWRVPVYECSECHTWLAEDNLANFQYCFKCGVKMEE